MKHIDGVELKKLFKCCDLLPDALLIIDREGRILFANEAAGRLLGREVSELAGRLCYEVVHGRKTRPDFCIHAKMLREGTSVSGEFYEPYLRKWLWAYAAPIFDEEGRPVACFHLIRDITGTKRTTLSVQLLERLLETIPGYFYLSSRDYTVLLCNTRFREWVGTDPVGKKCYQVIYGRDEPCPWCRQREVFEEGKVVSWEAENPRDGRWYFAINAPFDTETGERLKISLLFDVEERRRLEEKIKRLLEENPAGIFITDWEGRIHYINPSLKRLLKIPEGFDETQLMSLHFYVNPKERRKLLNILEERGEVSGLEIELKNYLGERIWVALTAKLVEEEGKRFIWGSLQDITSLKKAEEALVESEARFRTLAENAPLGVVLMDERGRIIYFNPAAERIFGYKAYEVLGKDLHITLSPSYYHHRYLESFARVRETGISRLQGKRLEFEARRKDGTIFPVEIFFSVIETRDKRYYLGLIQDISERKQLEEKRLRLEKHRALEILAGGIAHDFNNLLASLLGNIELAERLTKDERIKEILARTKSVADRAKALARDLLTFSKGDIPVPEEVDLRTLAKDLSHFLLHGSPIKLFLEIPEGISPVQVDPTHLAQTLQNLIINAKEAMPNGGYIFIQGAEVGGWVVIVIRDTGPGIKPHILPHIFEPGFTTKPAGTGLGLSVVKSVVERYGGRVEVLSKPGLGTAFKIYLPAGTKKEELKKKREVPTEVEGRFKGRILVMDDEEAIRQLLSEMLEYMGVEVATAEDGEEALRLYKEAVSEGRPFDLVILDLTVPGGKGGVWTLERLKEVDPEVKAVLSTGYTIEDVRDVMERALFVDFLRKPYTMRDVAYLLKKHLKGER